MVLAGNKVKSLSLVNHTAKTIRHHSSSTNRQNPRYEIQERSIYNEITKYIQYIQKQIGTFQDLKYEIKEVLINEDELNALNEWINVTEEKMTLFYDLVENIYGMFE